MAWKYKTIEELSSRELNQKLEDAMRHLNTCHIEVRIARQVLQDLIIEEVKREKDRERDNEKIQKG